jgi:hypothetical protein
VVGDSGRTLFVLLAAVLARLGIKVRLVATTRKRVA